MSEYMRQIILKGLVVKLDTCDIKGLSYAINKYGNNLNQIAKHINEKGGEFERQEFDLILEGFKEMQGVIYAKALGMEIEVDGIKSLDAIVYMFGEEFIEEYLKELE